MTTTAKSLTSARTLTRSASWNLLGMTAPMVVAVFAIPMLIKGMGKERFGLLSIVWMGVGYFSLFDLGIGRALTQMISERLGREETGDQGALIWTALLLLAGLGALGGILLFTLSKPLVVSVLNVPHDLLQEGIKAFRVLAFGVPVVIITAGIVGLLQAHQRFDMIAAVRVPLGVFTFAGPLISLQFTPSIIWATAVLLSARIIALLANYVAASMVCTELREPSGVSRAHLRPLLSFGGWLTVSNIVSPLMTYLDRFYIGSLLTMTAVSYYVTPYEMLSRLTILPQAIMAVLFPAMAAAHGGNQDRLSELYATSSKVIYFSMAPILASIFFFAPEALVIWLGEDFRDVATPVVRWLSAGWLINMLARPAFTVLQSAGRPDLVAKAHLTELLPYLCLLWWLTTRLGIAGVAAVWALRVMADAVILNALASRVFPALSPIIVRTYIKLILTGTVFGSLWPLESLVMRLIMVLVFCAASVWALWPIFCHTAGAFLYAKPQHGNRL